MGTILTVVSFSHGCCYLLGIIDGRSLESVKVEMILMEGTMLHDSFSVVVNGGTQMHTEDPIIN